MTHGRNKYQSRENRTRVREVLMQEWDPIGVAGVPEAADEYDAYGAKAYVMLMDEQASEQAIAAYLFEIATKHMGLNNVADLTERSNRAARTLSPCDRNSKPINVRQPWPLGCRLCPCQGLQGKAGRSSGVRLYCAIWRETGASFGLSP